MSDLWSKANRAANSARILFEAGEFEGACNRAYYAMFNAARALLAIRGFNLTGTKRHGSIIRAFSDIFVKEGTISIDISRSLERAAETRQLADYEPSAVGEESARAILNAMENFLAATERVVEAGKRSDDD